MFSQVFHLDTRICKIVYPLPDWCMGVSFTCLGKSWIQHPWPLPHRAAFSDEEDGAGQGHGSRPKHSGPWLEWRPHTLFMQRHRDQTQETSLVATAFPPTIKCWIYSLICLLVIKALWFHHTGFPVLPDDVSRGDHCCLPQNVYQWDCNSVSGSTSRQGHHDRLNLPTRQNSSRIFSRKQSRLWNWTRWVVWLEVWRRQCCQTKKRLSRLSIGLR